MGVADASAKAGEGTEESEQRTEQHALLHRGTSFLAWASGPDLERNIGTNYLPTRGVPTSGEIRKDALGNP